ncbi:MAG: hypothetical protein CM15mP8_4540 [Methanobacteriota archaeon]|nr:MAG: hypothetical protein CM15mP8_4540 [Euryarchaeota archaeon]
MSYNTSRLPTRRWIEKIDLSKINNYWITNTDNENSIKPHIDEVMNIISQGDNKSAMIYFWMGSSRFTVKVMRRNY